MEKSLVNVQPTLITDNQPLELVEPGERALYNPPVPAQPFTTFYATPSYPRSNAPRLQSSSASRVIVPLISMQLARPLPSSSAQHSPLLYGLDSVHYISESVGVVHVSRSADYRERYSSGFDHNMALRRRFALICGVRPCTLPPFLAATVALSTEARDQSILPASPSLSSSTWCRRSHTPASCQSLRRRQQVEPLPQPISGGRYDHGKPVLSTNIMPVSAARLDTRGRPPFGLGGSGGKSGSITSHSSSLNIGFAMC